jgi:hypothetical protein
MGLAHARMVVMPWWAVSIDCRGDERSLAPSTTPYVVRVERGRVQDGRFPAVPWLGDPQLAVSVDGVLRFRMSVEAPTGDAAIDRAMLAIREVAPGVGETVRSAVSVEGDLNT